MSMISKTSPLNSRADIPIVYEKSEKTEVPTPKEETPAKGPSETTLPKLPSLKASSKRVESKTSLFSSIIEKVPMRY